MAKKFTTSILITGDSADAVKAIRGVSKELDTLGKSVTSSNSRLAGASQAIGQLAKVGAAAFAAAVASASVATVALVKHGLEAGDALGETAKKIGITSEAYAVLSHAADLAGVSQGALGGGLIKLQKNIAAAASGTGAAADAFKRLGLDAKALMELPADQQLAAIAEAMKSVGNETERTNLHLALFGKSGAELKNITALGAEGLAKAAHEAEVLGLALTDLDTSKLGAAADAVDNVKAGFDGLGKQLAVQFAPLIEAIARDFFNATENAGGMKAVAESAFNGMVAAAAVAADALRFVQEGWLLLKAAIADTAAVALDAHNFIDPSRIIPRLLNGPSEAVQVLREQAAAARKELGELVDQAPAGEQLIERLREIQRKAEEAARAQTEAAGAGTTEADEKARADAKAAKEAAERAKKIADVIEQLEKEAATHGQTAEQVALYELAQLGASAADLARAKALQESIALLRAEEAAQKRGAKAAEERTKRLAENAAALTDVQAQILRLQGKGQEASAIEIRQRFAKLLAELEADGDQAGVALVGKLINLQLADSRLSELRDKIAKVLEQQQALERQAAARVDAGLETGATARVDVLEGADRAQAQLGGLRAELQALADEDLPGAAEEVQKLDADMLDLANTGATGMRRALIDLRAELQTLGDNFARDNVFALRDSLGQLFTDLATNATSTKEAFKDFARSLATDLASIAAQALATQIVVATLDKLGLAKPSGPDPAKAGAAGVAFAAPIVVASTGLNTAGATLTTAAGVWVPVAAAIQAAATQMIAAAQAQAAAAAVSTAATVAHTGGVVGSTHLPSRRVSSFAFAGAARYHTGGIAGLRSGEVPAVLRKGEEVLTTSNPRHIRNQRGGGAPIAVTSILVDDRARVPAAMDTAAGGQVIVSQIEANVPTIRQILGIA